MRINTSPALTWNWLKINYSDNDIKTSDNEAFIINNPEGITVSSTGIDSLNDGSAVGKEFVSFISDKKESIPLVTVGESYATQSPVIIRNTDFIGSKSGIIKFKLLKNSVLNVVIIVDSEHEDTYMTSHISFDVSEGASLNITELIYSKEGQTIYADISINEDTKAKVNVKKVVMGDGKVYDGLLSDMKGDKSSIDINAAYSIRNNGVYDFNYIADQKGKKTESNLTLNGVLFDKAQKSFKGTIDFKRGSKGSVGAENEDVLLINDDIINKTLPVILCTEEDVSGTHGATIGEINDEILLYMQSRGIDKENIQKILSNARIESVLDRIAFDDIREYGLKKLYGEEYSEE